jgi:hypothetical protein
MQAVHAKSTVEGHPTESRHEERRSIQGTARHGTALLLALITDTRLGTRSRGFKDHRRDKVCRVWALSEGRRVSGVNVRTTLSSSTKDEVETRGDGNDVVVVVTIVDVFEIRRQFVLNSPVARTDSTGILMCLAANRADRAHTLQASKRPRLRLRRRRGSSPGAQRMQQRRARIATLRTHRVGS